MVECTCARSPVDGYLLDDESRSRLPKIYGLDDRNLRLGALAIVKFVAPESSWAWYTSEFDGEDMFYGLIVANEKKIGFFWLSELEALNHALGLAVERDKNFGPKRLSELMKFHKNE